MRAAKSSEKKVTSAVRRLPSATRPRTPPSGVPRPMLARACLPCTTGWALVAPATMSGEGVWVVPSPSGSFARPVPSSPARRSSATTMKLESSEEPPWLMNGRVTPVRGSRRVTPPTMRKAWKEREAVRPTAVKALMSLLARAAVVRPRTASSMKSMSTAPPPRRPISSAMAEKMKSDSTTGMSVGMPLPMPAPTRLPSAMEKRDCTICRPEPEGSWNGSSQICTRTRTCENML